MPHGGLNKKLFGVHALGSQESLGARRPDTPKEADTSRVRKSLGAEPGGSGRPGAHGARGRRGWIGDQRVRALIRRIIETHRRSLGERRERLGLVNERERQQEARPAERATVWPAAPWNHTAFPVPIGLSTAAAGPGRWEGASARWSRAPFRNV